MQSTDRGHPHLRLVSQCPDWKLGLIGHFKPARMPSTRWRGNVAHVAFRPVGYRLVRLPDGWHLAWWRPRANDSRLGHICGPCTHEQAERLLERLRLEHQAPCYPPLDLRNAPNRAKEASQ